jgi:hypothetical protein
MFGRGSVNLIFVLVLVLVLELPVPPKPNNFDEKTVSIRAESASKLNT